MFSNFYYYKIYFVNIDTNTKRVYRYTEIYLHFVQSSSQDIIQEKIWVVYIHLNIDTCYHILYQKLMPMCVPWHFYESGGSF